MCPLSMEDWGGSFRWLSFRRREDFLLMVPRVSIGFWQPFRLNLSHFCLPWTELSGGYGISCNWSHHDSSYCHLLWAASTLDLILSQTLVWANGNPDFLHPHIRALKKFGDSQQCLLWVFHETISFTFPISNGEDHMRLSFSSVHMARDSVFSHSQITYIINKPCFVSFLYLLNFLYKLISFSSRTIFFTILLVFFPWFKNTSKSVISSL